MLINTQLCPVATVQMNYFDQQTRREILCVLEDGSIKADLVQNTLTIDQEVHTFSLQRNDTYRAMHLAVLEDKTEYLCSFDEGNAVLKFIQCIEESAQTGAQVRNNENG